MFYSIEKFLSRYTDVLITINDEDYNIATNFCINQNRSVIKINGVGININDINSIPSNNNIREQLNISKNDFVCTTSGRIERNKNLKYIIDSFKKISSSNIHLLVCGDGVLKEKMQNYVNKMNLDCKIHFLGYRNDVISILKQSDCYVSTSKREGLSRGVMETMACKLPCICSDIRGNKDLIIDGKGGFLITLHNSSALANRIEVLSLEKNYVINTEHTI